MTDNTTSEHEQVIVDQGKVTFSYSRKQNLGNYESEDVFVSSTHTVPTSMVDGYIRANGTDKMNVLKAHVWDALGLDMVFTDEGAPVLRPAVAAAPAIQVAPAPVAQPPQYAPPPQQPPAPSQVPQVQPPSGGMAAVGTYAPPPGPCGDCGMNDWWDNRADVDGRINTGQKVGPDWKCKNQQCKHGVFRPGTFAYNKSVGNAAPVVAQAVQQMAPPPGPTPPQGGWAPDEAPF